ncbi:outer membrane beta-barrel protein [Vibrio algivorus]|uniref:Outer membrane beta-barrel protein n=1 Tax=Vibrio algivorus TaxID=1667024 RepID=A0A557PGY3_9VIBR|nr:outer membrane beta-barrel protein [Vibrio algivorus]TVO39915.1 outer membrane beta-barrel protein [Vibrio algivorus]
MKLIYPCLLFAIGPALAPAAHAERKPESGVFLGAKGGYQFTYDDDINNPPTAGAVGVFGGYKFTPNWSWDLGYQYLMELEANDVSVGSWLVESAARYDYWLSNDWSLYGRLGVAYWNVDKNTTSSSMSETGVSPLVEAGAAYAFTPRWVGSMGYQFVSGIGSHDTGEYDSHSVMFSLSYQFGDTGPTAQELAAQRAAKQAQEEAALKATNDLNENLTVFGHQAIDIQFASGSSVISQAQRPSMSKQLTDAKKIMDEHPEVDVYFIGHTDSSGSEVFNQRLSERRAQSVAYELESKGISPSRIHIKGMGEAKASPVNDPADRRVEIVLACDACTK